MRNELLNQSRKVRKYAVSVATAMMALTLLLAPTKVQSQVLLDEDNYGSPRVGENGDNCVFEIILFEGGDGDQFLPLGEGWLLLGGFGAAYLLAKRRKHQED